MRSLVAGLAMLLVACGIVGPARPAAPPGSSASQPSPTATRPPVPGDWRLVFHDEFQEGRLNKDRWATCYDWNEDGCTISSNNELEWYQPGQVAVGNGQLTLTATRRSIRASDGRTYPWVSGMVSTGRDHWYAQPRRTFTYGYVAAAIRIPEQRGMLPQFWMMPASRFTPPEIDIMEFIGSTRELSMHVHWQDEGGERKQKGLFRADDFSSAHHVFAVLWEPDRLVWYVDGVERFRVTDPERIPHVPMEVLLNLAVGVPFRPPDTVDSARMRVDWVRVWQR